MIMTRKRIERLRSDSRLHIDAQLEELILAQLGEEPEPYEYTEQDLHEQTRKLINRYNEEHVAHNQHAGNPKPWEYTEPPSDSATLKRR